MSHITTIKTQIFDLDSLERAAQTLGLELVRGTVPHDEAGALRYKWYGRPTACDHLLRVVGAASNTYEVGLIEQSDGSFALAYDPYCGGFGLMDKIGPNASLLMQGYAVARVYATMGHDHSIEHFTDAEGRVQMRLVAHA